MAFSKKTWLDRIAEYPTRRRLKKSDGTDEIVSVSREEGAISQEGDAFSAANMNDLEDRVASEFNSLNLKLDSNYYSKNEQDNRFQPKSTQTTARSAGKWVRTYNGNGYYETDYISDSITFATNVSYGTDYFCDVSCNIPSNVRINEISNIQVTLLSGDGIAYASIKDYNSSVVNIRINAPANIVKNYIIMLKIWGS